MKKETGNDNIIGFACDIGNVNSVNEAFEKINKHVTHIDVVINNAGIMPGFNMDPENVSDQMDIDTLRTNIDGYWFVTKRALPLLWKSPAGFERTVVFVSSAAAWLEEPEPGFGMICYRASKAAENGICVGMHKCYVEDTPITKQVRGDKKLHRVVSLHPGFVVTGLGRETWHDKNASDTQIEEAKKGFGAISIEEGTDTLLWTVLSTDGIVQSGKHYYKRQIHSF